MRIRSVNVVCTRLMVAACLFVAGVLAAAGQAAADQARDSQGATELIWDQWGVPHIYSDDAPSAAHAFGWAQARSHGAVLLRYMMLARGRGAEFYGDEYRASDRAVRSLELYPKARDWYRMQTPGFRSQLDAFSAGINAYFAEHGTDVDPTARAVLPVTGVDVLAHGIRTMYQFLSLDSGCSQVLSGGIMAGDKTHYGSNAWAIAPSHSVDGHAMLLANPHLMWSGDFTFYEAQITTPQYHVYGTAIVGFPVLLIAFNETHGWTHTVNTIDGCDVYALTRTGEGYSYDGRARRFEAHTETIKVRQADGSLRSESLLVRRSVLGPVVEQDGSLYAIRVAGLTVGSFAGMFEQWQAMGAANNFEQFQSALRRMQLPMFNVIYADRDGHIEAIFGGLTPVRARGDTAYWQAPVSGATGELAWTSFVPFESLPAVIDPASGWVQNANGPPWYMTMPFLDPGKYPNAIAPDWRSHYGDPTLRDRRGLRMLTEHAKMSFDQLLADKYSTRSELATLYLDDLVNAGAASTDPDARAAAQVLAGWNGTMDADSRGAELFAGWAQAVARAAPGTSPEDTGVNGHFAVPFDFAHPLETPRGLKNPTAAVAGLAAAANGLRARGLPLDVPWGEVRRMRRGKFDVPANGGPSSLGVFRALAFLPYADGRSDAYVGDTFVAAVEFGVPLKARVFLQAGNSSDPASPHFGDQLPLTSRGEWRIPWMTREDLVGHVEGRTTFDRSGRATEYKQAATSSKEP